MGINNCKDKAMANEYVEDIVCQESEVPDNGMKVCDLGSDGGKVLLVKQKGEIFAIGTKCSHYGAPLVTGALGNGRVRCPWHGACFNLKSGDIEDFPGLDSIPCYSVEVVDGGGVKVKARKHDLEKNKRMKNMVAKSPSNSNTFVIVGGGAAGQVCAETLRQEGFSGRLVMICAEKYSPYDRIKLSKQLDLGIDKIQLRPDTFYKEHDIDIMLNTKLVKLDAEKKTLELDNGESISYNVVFLATGSKPRKINLPGIDLDNVFTLRSLNDASNINAALSPESNVVIYGSSFIGMETAAYCVSHCKSVTVVGRSETPFQESLGSQLGNRIAKLFTDKGVKLKMSRSVTEIKGETKVEGVVLSDGETIPTDVVILGLGSTYATEYLEGSGVDRSPSGSVLVNQFLETNCAGVFAGGDIAEAPVLAYDNNKRAAIGHWGLAHYHGHIAALNMVCKATPLKTVPFFWTMLFGTSFRYAGYGKDFDDTVGGGDLENLKYTCYYCKGDKVIAVTTVGVDPIAAAFAERISSGQELLKSTVISNPLSWHKE